MSILPLGLFKGVQTFLYQFTTGGASGKSITPVIVYGSDGNPVSSTIAGNVAAYGPDNIGDPPTHPPLYMGAIATEDGHIVPLTTTAGVLNVSAVLSPVAVQAVDGFDANGAPPTKNPVLVAGYDGANVRYIGVTASNGVKTASYDSAGNAITSQILSATPTAANRGYISVSICHGQVLNAPPAVTDGLWYDLRLLNDRSLIVSQVSVSGTNTQVAGTIVNSTALLGSNANRKGATIANDGSGQTLYVSLGGVCTPTNYTIALPPNAYYEVPYGYNGKITCVFSGATGQALVTELT